MLANRAGAVKEAARAAGPRWYAAAVRRSLVMAVGAAAVVSVVMVAATRWRAPARPSDFTAGSLDAWPPVPDAPPAGSR